MSKILKIKITTADYDYLDKNVEGTVKNWVESAIPNIVANVKHFDKNSDAFNALNKKKKKRWQFWKK